MPSALLINSTGRQGWPWEPLLLEPISFAKDASSIPRISIIVPSFNQGRYLEETIRAIILQDYPNYELIVIDADSTDNTLEIIRKYEPWITYWVSEPDRGQSHAIVKGLAVATGDIINWINSDDLVAPGAFHRIAADFDLDRFDVICGKCDYFLNDLNHLDLQGMRMGLGLTIGDTFNIHQINQPSTFFKASVIKKMGIDEQFRYTMDLDLWFRYLLQAGQERVLISENLLSYFRLHDASKTVAENAHFKGDIWRVHYNILYSLEQKAELLTYASLPIPNFERFVPTCYSIQVPKTELHPFIVNMAWMAVYHYNAVMNYCAARECLAIVRRYSSLLEPKLLKQLFKHYILPERFVRWVVNTHLLKVQ